MKKIFFVSIFFLFLAFCVHAAPLPWGIAINEEAKECAGYWGGDEFGFNSLPQGWIDIYPWSENWDKVSSVKECDVMHHSLGASIKICCEKNGYKYISENIGVKEEIKKDTKNENEHKDISEDSKNIEENKTIEKPELKELSKREIVKEDGNLGFIVMLIGGILVIAFLFFFITKNKKVE